MPRRHITPITKITYTAPIVPYPEMTHYMVIPENGKRVIKSISSLDWLFYHISCGLSIRKLIFYFTPIHHPYYYPYGKHNIVLEQTNELYFRVQFYHYYNVKNERVDIPPPQQYYDFCALEELLYQHPILYYSFYVKLLRPSFPYYESPNYLTA